MSEAKSSGPRRAKGEPNRQEPQSSGSSLSSVSHLSSILVSKLVFDSQPSLVSPQRKDPKGFEILVDVVIGMSPPPERITVPGGSLTSGIHSNDDSEQFMQCRRLCKFLAWPGLAWPGLPCCRTLSYKHLPPQPSSAASVIVGLMVA